MTEKEQDKYPDVYEYTEMSHKQDDCVLAVDFHFDLHWTKAEAIEEIEKLVALADNTDIEFNGWKPKIYAVSVLAEYSEEDI